MTVTPNIGWWNTQGWWNVSTNQPWLRLNRTTGTPGISFILTADPNHTTSARSGTVTVTSSGAPTQQFTVTQLAGVSNATVTFNANGGTVNPTTRSVPPGTAVGALPTPTRDGFSFAGWFNTSAQTGGTQFGAGSIISADTTMWARWTAANCTVTFNANGGTVSPTTRSVSPGTAVGALPTPTRDGFTFAGWFNTSAQTGGVQFTAASVINADTTMWARWTQNMTVTFEPNDGTVSQTTRSVQQGTAVGTLPTLTRPDFVFLGWFSTPGPTGGTQFTASSVINANTTMWARWTLATLTLSPTTASFGVNPTRGTPIEVTSTLTWSAPVSSDPTWLTVSNIAPTNRTGNGSFMINAAHNGTGAERTGTITVTASGITRTINVTQVGTNITRHYDALSNSTTTSNSANIYMAAARTSFRNTFGISLVLQNSNTTTNLIQLAGCQRPTTCDASCGHCEYGSDCRARHHRSSLYFLDVNQSNRTIFRFVDFRLCYFATHTGHVGVNGVARMDGRDTLVTLRSDNPRRTLAHEISHLYGVRDNECTYSQACVMRSTAVYNRWCDNCRSIILQNRTRT